MKRFVFRFLCIVLLLAGQQAALTHALAHARNHAAHSSAGLDAAAGTSAPAQPGERYALCDFDYAFSQVLGAVHSGCIPPPRVDASFGTYAPSPATRAAVTEVPFLIRGPPQLL